MRTLGWGLIVGLFIAGSAMFLWWAMGVREKPTSHLAAVQAGAPVPVPATKAVAAAPAAARPATPAAAMRDPNYMCNALAEEGLPPTPEWRQSLVNPAQYVCFSRVVAIGAGTPPNSIGYVVQSFSPERVETMEIVVEIPQRDGAAGAKERLVRSATVLLMAIGVTPPQSLATDIAAERPAGYGLPIGKVELMVDRGTPDTMRVRVTSNLR